MLIRMFLFAGILLGSLPASAWSPYTHGRLAEESLKEVAQEWKLNTPVLITSFDQFLKKMGQEKPEIKTRDDFIRWLKINPRSRFDKPYAQEIVFATTTPLKILIAYAPRPDDGRDKNLSYDPGVQFWFGSGTATVSQAFRHMEKPSFHLKHPLDTFGFPLGSVGQASERAQIYFDLSLLAYKLGEPYWAWNFLGCALHYIQDIQNPYHAAQLLPPIAIKGIPAYWNWGRRMDWGIIKTLTHLTSNLHHYFEGYVEWVLRPETPLNPIMDYKTLWVEALRGKDFFESKKIDSSRSIRQLAKGIRDFSNHFAFESLQATLDLSGDQLIGPIDYSIGTRRSPFPQPPTSYFNPNIEKRKQAAARIKDIIESNFRYQGKAIRTVIRSFLDQI